MQLSCLSLTTSHYSDDMKRFERLWLVLYLLLFSFVNLVVKNCFYQYGWRGDHRLYWISERNGMFHRKGKIKKKHIFRQYSWISSRNERKKTSATILVMFEVIIEIEIYQLSTISCVSKGIGTYIHTPWEVE